MSAPQLSLLEEKIGYTFRNKQLLHQALTHKSYCYPDPLRSNERLEFLGDSVLQLCAGEFLYAYYPNEEEGELTRIRSRAVKRESLANCAREISLGRYMQFSPGEQRSGGGDKDSILENAFEALVGAVYLDGGYEEAKRMILAFLTPVLTDRNSKARDDKTRLQEYYQASGGQVSYECIAVDGPPHDRVFTVCVKHQGQILGQGRGKSKKEAESRAAQSALKTIDERG